MGTTTGTRGGIEGSKFRGGEYEGKRGVRLLGPHEWRWRTFADEVVFSSGGVCIPCTIDQTSASSNPIPVTVRPRVRLPSLGTWTVSKGLAVGRIAGRMVAVVFGEDRFTCRRVGWRGGRRTFLTEPRRNWYKLPLRDA